MLPEIWNNHPKLRNANSAVLFKALKNASGATIPVTMAKTKNIDIGIKIDILKLAFSSFCNLFYSLNNIVSSICLESIRITILVMKNDNVFLSLSLNSTSTLFSF